MRQPWPKNKKYGIHAVFRGRIAGDDSVTLQQLGEIDDRQIRAVREGLAYETFILLRDALRVSTEDLAALLGIPRRTLSKRQHEGGFTVNESNALSRVARIHREAVQFFGDEDDARAWLKTTLPTLGATPLSLLDTDPGAEAVSVLLRQLAWGLYP
jgi:putative toxin-antitoxin system antitoxin component (TIGR02293 family)